MIYLQRVNIAMNNQAMMFNFGDYGFPEWVAVHPIEMQVIWEGVMSMFDHYTTNEIIEMSDKIEHKLIAHAWCNFDCDEDWVSHAVMLTAIQGWLGKEIAPHYIAEC